MKTSVERRIKIMTIFRIAAILILGITGSLPGNPAAAQAPVDIKIALDWAFQGPVAMLLYGQEQGYFSQEGLNVTIDRGFGSADAVTKAATGAYSFALGDINAMVEFNAKNPDKQLIAIFMKYNRPPFSVITFVDRGIKEPKDLEGRKVASNEGLAARRMFPLFAKGAKIDMSKIEWVNVAPPMLDTIVIQKTADAGVGFWTTQSLNMQAAKIPASQLKVFLYSDYGVDLYGNTFLTTKRFASEHPDIVKRFNRAITRSFKAMVPDPSIAMPALKRREGVTDEAIELQRLKVTLDNFVFTDETKRIGIGAVDPARLDRALDQLMTVLDLPARPRPEDVFNGTFLPDVKDRLVGR
jgi:NitT/TauT family transport system substrate-binding protein